MSQRSRGRPVGFDRDRAVREAARLFWQSGYSGTSTRALSEALGISSSSLYAAFGSKAGLFEVTVRRYADRYHRIYRSAVDLHTLGDVVQQLLCDSVIEFTQDSTDHPGCLAGSAALVESPAAFDARAYVARLQRDDLDLLIERFDRAGQESGQLPSAGPEQTAQLVQTVWHGLSVRATQGESRENLMITARTAGESISRPWEPATAS